MDLGTLDFWARSALECEDYKRLFCSIPLRKKIFQFHQLQLHPESRLLWWASCSAVCLRARTSVWASNFLSLMSSESGPFLLRSAACSLADLQCCWPRRGLLLSPKAQRSSSTNDEIICSKKKSDEISTHSQSRCPVHDEIALHNKVVYFTAPNPVLTSDDIHMTYPSLICYVSTSLLPH